MIFYKILRCISPFLLLVFLGITTSAFAEKQLSVDDLLSQTKIYLDTAPEKSADTLAQLQVLQSTFTKKQRERYYVQYASSLGLRGMHKERVLLVQSFIDQVIEPEARVQFLYELSDAYTNLGEYEKALGAINQTIVLLPQLVDLVVKISTLQGAITLLNSLHAYDEAMVYADRMYALGDGTSNSIAKCYGTANRVDIDFLRGNSMQARASIPEAIQICDLNGRKVVSLIVKTLAVVDTIYTGTNEDGLSDALLLLSEFSKTNQTSDYVVQLTEAVARAYLHSGKLAFAEQYGLQAYQLATSKHTVQLQEKASETMATIKRAQGQFNSALEYYDINLALKKKALDDQLQKNLAYQRVKFDTQDKANQLALLEQKNKNLTIEKALQQGKNQNLLLLMTLGLILLAILGAWLVKTLQQKNIFRTSSQVDGLTQVSNRSHFITCATQSFKNAENRVSIVLFDMDSFKNINDTFGHAVGDWVLKTVCDTVKTQLRKADALGRLGGEEFAICLPNFTEEEAQALAERCRAAIAAIDTNPSGFSFVITASFGVATRGMRGQYSFEETLAAADKALYFAKNEGRNRVSLYQ